MENPNVNTTEAEILNPEPNLLLRDDSSEKEDIENELETKIVTRQINATKTTAHDELAISKEQESNYVLIKFNMLFTSSEDCKYSWIVYHTQKKFESISIISLAKYQLKNYNYQIIKILIQ